MPLNTIYPTKKTCDHAMKNEGQPTCELIGLRPFCAFQENEGQWVYQAGVLAADEIRPGEELAGLLDSRSLDELYRQAMDALNQILARAHGGDAAAISRYANLVRGAVGSLDDLSEAQKNKVKAHAETLPDWPVLLSQNPADVKSAEQLVKSLAVGTKSSVQTRPRSRVDRSTFWTQLAERAFSTCKINRTLVPALSASCTNARQQRESTWYWDTEAVATFHYLPGGDVVIIPDWARDCVPLGLPVTSANFPEWWRVVKLAVLQHWHTSPDDYGAALKKIGGVAETEESRQRSRAIDSIKQAFENLTGVP